MLKYSGLYQDGCADLMVVCQIYDQNEPLGLPVSTSYKAFTSRWKYVIFVLKKLLECVFEFILVGTNG